MNQIVNHIKEAKHLLLVSHRDPDGDAIGSLLALGLAAGKLGKKATLFNASPIPAVYRFLPSAQRIVRHIKKANTYDVALILDCGNLSRIGDVCETVEKIPVIINIDLQAVGNWAERRGVAYSSYQEMAALPQVYDLIQEEIEQVNGDLAQEPNLSGSQIHRFLVLPMTVSTLLCSMFLLEALSKAFTIMPGTSC